MDNNKEEVYFNDLVKIKLDTFYNKIYFDHIYENNIIDTIEPNNEILNNENY